MDLLCVYLAPSSRTDKPRKPIREMSQWAPALQPVVAVLLDLFVLSCAWAFLHCFFCLTLAHVDLALCLQFPVFLLTLMASWSSSALSGTPWPFQPQTVSVTLLARQVPQLGQCRFLCKRRSVDFNISWRPKASIRKLLGLCKPMIMKTKELSSSWIQGSRACVAEAKSTHCSGV